MADPRFARLASDPRFLRAKKDEHKVALDDRFAHMLKSDEFGSKAKVDKKGRKVDSSVPSDLRKFYKIENEVESESEDEKLDLARGEGVESSDEEEEIIMEQAEEIEEEIPTGDETHRFAVVNLDWDYVKAKHLYKLFDAFKGTLGAVKSVSIYPSEFGKQQMSKEFSAGPPSVVFDNDEGKDFNMTALRKYQVDRLKYYYAVVQCDSVSTATNIFNQCDGSEFESSANFLDLRYVPDEMEFEEKSKDIATEPPLTYQPVEFVTKALQHSKVALTWDVDDPDRFQTTRKNFSKEDIKEMDFKAYLASDSDSEDEDLKAKYKALIQSDEEEENENMEITFNPGLTERASKLLEDRKDLEVFVPLIVGQEGRDCV